MKPIINPTFCSCLILILGTATQSLGDIVTGEAARIGGGHTLSGIGSTITGGTNNKATANFATISGGSNNLANAHFSLVCGGFENKATGTNSVVVGGFENTNSSPSSFIGGGYENIISNAWGSSVIVGGYENTNLGAYATIAGGAYNICGASTGQELGNGNFIGGGVGNFNNGAWGSIVGGFSNHISRGLYSAIGGGYGNFVDASALGDSGAYNTISGGQANTIGNGATLGSIGGGYQNNVRSFLSTIGGGYGNRIDDPSGSSYGYSTIAGGLFNTTTNMLVTIPGGANAKGRSFGQFVYASGALITIGDAQSSMYVVRRTTTGATETELFLDNTSARMNIPNGATWTFEIQLSARKNDGTSAGYHYSGMIKNYSNTTTLVGVNTLSSVADAGAGTWSVSIQGDDTNDALAIKVTGAASSTIRWVATVRTSEVIN